MPDKLKNKKIAIIGAGIAGVTIGMELSKNNDIYIFDKSRGIGGRMPTKRIGKYHFDHGAQFFTASDAQFIKLCKNATENNIIEKWKGKFQEIIIDNKGQKIFKNTDQDYLVAKPQMNNLCKYLAKDLNVNLGKKLISIERLHHKWSLDIENDQIYSGFDYLLFAIPSNQLIDFIPISFKYYKIIKDIKMLGCYSLMLGFKKPLDLDFDYASISGSNILSISVNNSKPSRPDNFALVIHSSNSWAEENIDDDIEKIKDKMLASVQEIINLNNAELDYMNIHRWRYANANYHKGPNSLFDPNLNIGVCGDWLISGKVENAYLSAIDLYKNITQNNSRKINN